MGFNIGPRVIRATGGSISREGNFRVHTFPSRRVSEGLVFEVDLGNPNCTGRIKANSTFVDGIIKDLSGNGNDLTVVNDPTFGLGEGTIKGGGHISFSEASQQYADKANPSGVRTHGNIPFTIEAWARRTNADSWNTVISMRGQYTQLGFHTTNFMFGRNGGGGNTFIFPTGAAQDTWYQLVMTYDGNSSYDIEAFVDGSLKATGSMGWNSSVSNTTGIRLGAFSASSEMFTGNVAIARIYNRCLSREEVAQNYDADKVRFKSYTNTFTPTCSGNGGKVEVLTVAGGGGGGRAHAGGGGGAGGLIHTPKYSVTNTAISVTVGAGGTSGGSVPISGRNSTFGTLTAIGGGAGGSEDTTAGRNGYSGGSGGGGSGYADTTNGGTATSGQGFAGGKGGFGDTGATYGCGAGGGGAGGIGGNGTEGVSSTAGGGTPGPGGSGKEFDISGEKKFYAGGGGGGYWRGTGSGNFPAQGGAGGSGIGGVGGRLESAASLMGTNGLNYTGSGGGGSPGAGNARRGGNGGAGTVIVRYPAEDYNIEILVVAGGGGGGSNSDINGSAGGGGGAGGVIYYETYAVKGGKNYMVEVGPGGAGGGGSARNIPDSRGKNGHRSTFGDLLALGGGGGGGGYDGTVGDGRNDGMVGGSGGGGGSNAGTPAAGRCLAGKGTIDQGNNGGNGSDGSGSDGAGGGGGAGAVGGDGVGATATAQGGAGGIGNAYSITGTSTYYAGGGGGGGHTNDSDSGGGAGGNGGGGAGGNVQQDGNNATANTGGGGGGAGCRQNNNDDGGNGGSGIIIVAYKGPQRGEGGAVSTTSRPGYTVHTFGTTGNGHKYLYIA